MDSTPTPASMPASSLGWGSLTDLYFRPTRFFQGTPLDRGRGWLLAILLVGIAGAMDRIDQNLIRAELGRARPGWHAFGPWVTGSWLAYWPFVIAAGAIGAVFIWYIGGWWYNVRLRWSGAGEFDKRQGRLLFTFAALVAALPALAYTVAATAMFPDYRAAWASEELWSLALLIFPFWSVAVSYRGVRAKFPVRIGSARLWFVLLPCLAYLIVLGVIGTLYALVEQVSSGTPV